MFCLDYTALLPLLERTQSRFLQRDCKCQGIRAH